MLKAKNLEQLKEILDKIEACIITRAEHKLLNHKIEGRYKYIRAGIKLYDTKADST